MDHIEVRQALLNTNVLKVYAAARAVGVSFRNGLNKAECVQLLAQQRKMFDAWNWIQANGGPEGAQPVAQPNPVSVPAKPVQDAPAQQDSPTQDAPQQPVATEGADAALNALRALLTPKLDAAQVENIARASVKPLLADFASTQENRIRADIASAIAALPQGTVIHLPGKPEPIKFEGSQHRQFGDLLTALQCGLNVYLVGGASSGKTFAAEQAAKALERKFYAQGAVSYAHELMGYVDAHGKYVRTQFREAFETGGLILLDEFDGSAAEACLVVNAALANGFCAFPDGMIAKHPEFLCVVGANTDGSGATMQYAGRARLDGAFLDRFVQIEWEIDPNIEKAKARGQGEWLACVRAVREYMRQQQIHDVAATVRATDFGATLLAAGVKREKVLAQCLKRGALVAQWPQILKLSPVGEFLAGF